MKYFIYHNSPLYVIGGRLLSHAVRQKLSEHEGFGFFHTFLHINTNYQEVFTTSHYFFTAPFVLTLPPNPPLPVQEPSLISVRQGTRKSPAQCRPVRCATLQLFPVQSVRAAGS